MKTGREEMKAYWRTNITYMVVLLTIWATVSYLCGIVFVNELNAIHFGGFPLGFWFAQQGAIYTFVVLIFVYFVLMLKLDKKFGINE